MENFKLKEAFFRRDTHLVAKELLGKILIRKHKNGRIQAGIIVETEAYHGFSDKASHASRARTKRTEVMFGPGGFYYVYLIYGIYWNLNIVAGENEFPSAILIRALEPLYDSEFNFKELTFQEKFKLASGPGKLCRWLGICKEFYGKSVEDETLFIVEAKDFPAILRAEQSAVEKSEDFSSRLRSNNNFQIITDKRIGVEYAKESAEWDWRYYIGDNKFVSKT